MLLFNEGLGIQPRAMGRSKYSVHCSALQTAPEESLAVHAPLIGKVLHLFLFQDPCSQTPQVYSSVNTLCNSREGKPCILLGHKIYC